jgi:phenylpropionate dioxygenase-like ring-hydroxylating dioxygenase large terminal subunit
MPSFVPDVEDSHDRLREAVAAQLQRPDDGLPRYFYRSEVVYRTELDNLFFRSWLYAGHVSQVPNAGDYFLYTIAEESVIVVRGEDGAIRALINSCRHRGSRVCEVAQGNRKAFTCPYHGWVYGADGALRAARHMEGVEGFRREDLGLKQARVAVRFGLIFINFDPDAYDFDASLAQVDAQLRPYHLETAKIAHRETYPVDANWKVALGNYLECYHCETAHRAYSKIHTFKEREHVVAPLNRAMWARAEASTGVPDLEKATYRMFREAPGFGACVYTSRYALFADYRTGSRDGAPVAPLMGDFKGYDGGAGDCQFGPLTYMLNYPDHCILFRYVPYGIAKTDMEIVWFVRGDAVEGVDYDREQLTWLWHATTLEDKRIMQLNAEGVNSRFFEPGPQHPEFEDTPKRFLAWYLHALAGDFSVVPPTPRAHRTSACEVAGIPDPSDVQERT